MHRLLLVVAVLLACSSTAALIAVQGLIAAHLPQSSTTWILFIASAAAESTVAAVMAWRCWAMLRGAVLTRRSNSQYPRLLAVVVTFHCTTAAAVSIFALIQVTKDKQALLRSVESERRQALLVAMTVSLSVGFTSQLLLAALFFLGGRRTIRSDDEGFSSSLSDIKSISYSETNPSIGQFGGSSTTDVRKPPPSSAGGMSTSGTMTTVDSSSQAIRPVGSKTRLLSTRSSERHRPASLDSIGPMLSRDNSFDSWDRSSLDAGRGLPGQDVLVPALSRPRFLETIPASPISSGMPSPGPAAVIHPPRPAAARSRSYSPTPRRKGQTETALTRQNSSSSEAHIHPLFRSDSPTPPPLASPGTNVLAAPCAGQVIAHRQSLRSLRRMRSGSLPAAPSPLSRQSSLDDARQKCERDEQYCLTNKMECDEGKGDTAAMSRE